MPSFLTFLSDYGLDDAFVGVCHGVVARIAPEVRILDICHQLAAQDVEQGAVVLAAAVPYLPVGVHLALVDPVSKASTRPVVVRTADGSTFLAPDNGLSSQAWAVCGGVVAAYEVTNRELWLDNPSKLFRGRDIFSPVAARLATGLPADQVGPAIDPAELVVLTPRQPTVDDDHVHGEVRAVDHFGNLSLNVARADLEAAGMTLGDSVEVRVGGRTLHVPFTVTYGDVPRGRMAVCEDSYRHITIAVNQGDASRTLRCGRGDPLVISRVVRPSSTPARPVGVFDPVT